MSGADPLSLLERAAAGDFDHEVRRFLADGAGSFLRAGGVVPLEKCLRLPGTPARLRKARRDVWLRAAWDAVEADSDWGRSCALALEVARFGAALWPRWRVLQKPPAGTSRLRECLFQAFKVDPENIPTTAPGIDKVLGR